MKALILTMAVCAGLLAACGSDDSGAGSGAEAGSGEATETRTKPTVQVPAGEPPTQLQIEDIEEGTGAEAKAGDEVTVEYVLAGYGTGEEIESSWGGEPLTFTLGQGDVIPGWDQGIEGMKVGSRRELIIPPQLAYGANGSPPAIGPEETLVFVVDLLQAL